MDQTGSGSQSDTVGQTGMNNQTGMGNQTDQKPTKSLTAFLVWSVFFASVGVHNFYAGNIGKGILAILFFWTGIPVILGFFTCLFVSKMSIEDINIKYNRVTFLDCDKDGRRAFFVVSVIFVIGFVFSVISMIAMWSFVSQEVLYNKNTW